MKNRKEKCQPQEEGKGEKNGNRQVGCEQTDPLVLGPGVLQQLRLVPPYACVSTVLRVAPYAPVSTGQTKAVLFAMRCHPNQIRNPATSPVLTQAVRLGISLHLHYAMSGTRMCYALVPGAPQPRAPCPRT
eukprot:573595-Rhodomonas_salina.1